MRIHNILRCAIVYLIALFLTLVIIHQGDQQKQFLSNLNQEYLVTSNPRELKSQTDFQKPAVFTSRDTNFTGFNIVKVKLEFLPNFKNPCWLEKYTGEDVYKNNTFIKTPDFPFRVLNGEALPYLPPKGVSINMSTEICGNEGLCRLRCLPYYMVVGVTKSGTSDICNRMVSHPRIYGGLSKELFWWNQYRFNLLNATLGDYVDLFDNAAASVLKSIQLDPQGNKHYTSIIGECTAMTFNDMPFWRQNPVNIDQQEPIILNPYDVYKLLPNLKIMVTLRNPVKRLYSHYNFMKDGAEPSGSPKDFHNHVIGSISWWNNCIKEKLLPRRTCAFGSPQEMPPVYTSIGDRSQRWPVDRNYSAELQIGIYVIYANEWLKYFSQKNILFIKMEEYSLNRTKAFNDVIFPFLDVEQLYGDQLEYITGGEHHNQLQYNEPMLPETEVLLKEFYRPYNKELADVLGSDKWLWSD